ncbi:hypothetical protein XENORESO_002840 [Xenotaenia resolanae]|uniref:Uncharacterized protein n=1 Tax=Xenotaenia resolanae TaxID=208358 RepID=A0ABV0VX35_9TELE
MFLESSWKPGVVVYGDLDHAPDSLPGSRTGAATAELRDELTDLIHEQTCVGFLHPPLVILGRSRSQERTHPVRSGPIRSDPILRFVEEKSELLKSGWTRDLPSQLGPVRSACHLPVA